ncbi:lipopolysaccharide biosynthesis protein [Coralloluteibacterium stylophorae]|uniref:Lipopolysaccharide biosynthesis protein n=1 Tax=Coralloluteibacterium stylophorae TaxID=1776034 RepID=A0A8J7VT93_9GAMM|nr:lipopolysaccharide biosynthesis protein [Coralloluteibacterium stylophorae]MBS7457152.1 lipopolysaccharide biosynthesis protein [Coralloluteibacterium stylophorae]
MSPAPESRASRTARASLWVTSGKVLARGIDFLLLLVLARVLSPEDFGLVAMAMTPVLIVEAILEVPVVQAILRVREPVDATYDTAFTLAVLRGLALAVVLAGIAWPLAEFYDEPRLPLLLCVLAIAPVLRGTLSPRMAVFMRDMDFRRDFVLELAGKGTAFVVAVIVAFATRSHWAIVAATLATPLTMNLLSYRMAPYRPRLGLSQWPQFADMLGWNSLAQLISAVNWQSDRLLLPRFVDTDTVGRYSMASNLTGIPQQAIVLPMTRPLMAAFSQVESTAGLAGAYRKASAAVFAVAAPILLAMGLLAEPLIRLALGREWLAAAPLLQWLAIGTLASLPVMPMAPLAMAMDRTRLVTLRMFAELVVKLPLLLWGLMQYGAEGAVAARNASIVIAAVVAMLLVRRLTGLGVVRQIRALARSMLALAAMAGVLVLLAPPVGEDMTALVLRTALAGAAGVAAYGLISILLWMAAGRPPGMEATAWAQAMRRLSRRG